MIAAFTGANPLPKIYRDLTKPFLFAPNLPIQSIEINTMGIVAQQVTSTLDSLDRFVVPNHTLKASLSALNPDASGPVAKIDLYNVGDRDQVAITYECPTEGTDPELIRQVIERIAKAYGVCGSLKVAVQRSTMLIDRHEHQFAVVALDLRTAELAYMSVNLPIHVAFIQQGVYLSIAKHHQPFCPSAVASPNYQTFTSYDYLPRPTPKAPGGLTIS